ncbi:MAG TPA: DeoR/GlpR family DNA-binding transcription regulator [Candidatus Dormibacteraeota bacterium]
MQELALATEERLTWLRQRLHERGRIAVGQAAGELRVSEMTVRRDLRTLEELGWARRVRGGALPVGPAQLSDRQRRRARAKGVIATKLAGLVPDLGAVALDASSTVLRLATALPPIRSLDVITNSLGTFESLQGQPGVRAMLTGGTRDARTGSLVGPLAVASARRLATARFFMSAAAVDQALGPCEASLEEVEVKLALAEVSAEVVLAVDSSKLNSRAVAPSLGWEQISLLVTELDPSDRRLEHYRQVVQVV